MTDNSKEVTTTKSVPKGYELDGMIVATTYLQSLLGTVSIATFTVGMFSWLTGLPFSMIFFAASIVCGLFYWFIDRVLGDFKSSGTTNRMQLMGINKRVKNIELQLAK